MKFLFGGDCRSPNLFLEISFASLLQISMKLITIYNLQLKMFAFYFYNLYSTVKFFLGIFDKNIEVNELRISILLLILVQT